MMRSCGNCDLRSWHRDGEAVELDGVLTDLSATAPATGVRWPTDARRRGDSAAVFVRGDAPRATIVRRGGTTTAATPNLRWPPWTTADFGRDPDDAQSTAPVVAGARRPRRSARPDGRAGLPRAATRRRRTVDDPTHPAHDWLQLGRADDRGACAESRCSRRSART